LKHAGQLFGKGDREVVAFCCLMFMLVLTMFIDLLFSVEDPKFFPDPLRVEITGQDCQPRLVSKKYGVVFENNEL
jgi:hypothetical protein